MAFRGAWSRAQRTTPPADRNPNLGVALDAKQHSVDDQYADPFSEPTPSLPSGPEYLYALDDYFPPPVYVTDPVITEPEGHQYGVVQEGGQDQLTAIGEAYVGHMADYGAADVHHWGDPIERADRDVYRTDRIEAEFATSGSRAALTRGRNSLPENNPDGPPAQGHYVMRWIDRQFTRRGIRTDMQPLRPYTAGIARQVPAPTDSNGNAYTSPYARIANARQLKLTTPQLRRVPRPVSDDAQSDGTADPQYLDPQYWGWQ